MRENEKYDCTDKCIETSTNDQEYYQSQNSQNDILEISIGIDSIHDWEQKWSKIYLRHNENSISFEVFHNIEITVCQ